MESKPEPAHEPAKPAAASSVMDVVAPPPADADDEAKETDPLDKLAAEDIAAQKAIAKKADKQPAPKSPTKPKPPGNDVRLAIIATVIIVIGLAALATYAYLQTSK